LSFERQLNSLRMPMLLALFSSSPGAISCGAIRLEVATGPVLEKNARSSCASPTEWSFTARLAPMASPFFVVAGAPRLPRSGMPPLSASRPLFPAETKTSASPLSRRNWSMSCAPVE
jgi:hypothetical protein